MIQREVGERLASPAGSRAYGASSVLAQLACEVRVAARDSAHRLPSGPERRLRAGRDASASGHGRRGGLAGPCGRSSADAFAHRRKTLAGSLALAGGPPVERDRVRAALAQIGHPPDARAERLSPEDFRALAGILGL